MFLMIVASGLAGGVAFLFGVAQMFHPKGRSRWLTVASLVLGASIIGLVVLCVLALAHFGEVPSDISFNLDTGAF